MIRWLLGSSKVAPCKFAESQVYHDVFWQQGQLSVADLVYPFALFPIGSLHFVDNLPVLGHGGVEDLYHCAMYALASSF